MSVNFPTNELTSEDYGPIQLFEFKEYYKYYLLKLINKVSLFY